MMELPEKTAEGTLVCRRCEQCGTRCRLVLEDQRCCILRCPQCSKEFRLRRIPFLPHPPDDEK